MASAAAQRDWLKRLHHSLGHMTEVVVCLASVQLPIPDMRMHLIALRDLDMQLVDTYRSVSPPQSQLHVSLRAEYSSFISDIVLHVGALVPVLTRLGSRLNLPSPSSSVGMDEEQVFWRLWMFLTTVCTVFEYASDQWAELWPLNQRSFQPFLYPMYDSLLRWLLDFTRSPTWLAMTPRHGLRSRNDNLLNLVNLPIKLLSEVSHTSTSVIVKHLGLLPATVVPMLCCILTEQFSSVPSLCIFTPPPSDPPATSVMATTYAHGLFAPPTCDARLFDTFDHLTAFIHNLTGPADHTCVITQHNGFLASPAVLHYLKAMIVLQQERSPAMSSSIFKSSILSLQQLLALSPPQHAAPLLSTSEGSECINQDKDGLPLHMNALLSKAALATDRRLLHALSTHMERSGGLAEVCYDVQVLVVIEWAQACSSQSAAAGMASSAETFTEPPAMIECVLGLSKQCSRHVLQWMQQRHRILLACKGNGTSKPCISHLDNKDTGKGVPPAAAPLPASRGINVASLWTAVGCTAMRNIVYLSSRFSRHYTYSSSDLHQSHFLWLRMPGWSAVLQALTRGRFHSSSPTEASNVATAAAHSLALLCDSADTELNMTSSLCLSATVRKIIMLSLQPVTHSTGACQQGSKTYYDAQQLEHRQHTFNALSALVPTMLVSVSALTRLHALIRKRDQHNCTSNIHCSTQHCDHEATPSSSSSSGSSGGGGSSSGDGKTDHANGGAGTRHSHHDTDKVHQLQTSTLFTLIHLMQWMNKCKLGGQQQAAWMQNAEQLEAAREVFEQLPLRGLKELVLALLPDARTMAPENSGSERKVRILWEGYVMTHFDGRLTPGCCNMDCINVDEISESALRTLLCSGCRRARYCSVECQKAAWREGGHSSVCNTGQSKK